MNSNLPNIVEQKTQLIIFIYPKITKKRYNKKTIQFQSLSGKQMTKEDLTHNNMVPFFGSKVTQQTGGTYEGLLDVHTGSGSQQIKKELLLFLPHKKT